MITVQNYKDYAGIEDNSKDVMISKQIEAIELFVKTYCNDSELEGDSLLDMTMLEMIDFNFNVVNGVSSQSIEQNTINYMTDFPSKIYRILNKYRRLHYV